jgi:protein-disulfide isomerase
MSPLGGNSVAATAPEGRIFMLPGAHKPSNFAVTSGTILAMSKMAKPLIIIVIALVIAGGAAFYMSKQSAVTTEVSGSSSGDSLAPGGGRVRGAENAALTLVEFGDYQCPSCGYYAPIVDEMLHRYPQDVKLVFHHYPLVGIHPWAMAAAKAAEAAGDQGKFWEMHDMLYANQEAWSRSQNAESMFLSFAAQIGLDNNRFMQSMRSPLVEQRVLEDVVRAREGKVDVTPTFFINGQRVTSRPDTPDKFSELIQAALRNK